MAAHRKLITMLAGGGITHASGGIGTFIRYLADRWATVPGAPQVRVIDTRGEGGKASMAVHFPKAIAQLIYLRASGGVDVLHIHMSAYGSAWRKSILTLTGAMLGVPVIVHMHGSNFDQFFTRLPRLFQSALRFVLNRARFIIVLGEAWSDLVVTGIGLAPEKVRVIFNGVPRPVSAPGTEQPRGGPVRILFLGQLGERKGVPDLLAALQLPRLLSKSWTATFAGDGPVEEFRTAVAKAGLQDRVTLPGWVDREAASNLLHRSDIFVLPSHFEAMPIAILEALAHSVPVIATPVGAIPEFLIHNQNALLVPPGAPEELADALLRLIGDPEEGTRLGKAGHRTFLDRFDISVAADRLITLYDLATKAEGDTDQHSKRARPLRQQ
jgi:glycosyltransferase involved in cell wall biosynthesis